MSSTGMQCTHIILTDSSTGPRRCKKNTAKDEVKFCHIHKENAVRYTWYIREDSESTESSEDEEDNDENVSDESSVNDLSDSSKDDDLKNKAFMSVVSLDTSIEYSESEESSFDSLTEPE